jgi:hypothetical protein
MPKTPMNEWGFIGQEIFVVLGSLNLNSGVALS